MKILDGLIADIAIDASAQPDDERHGVAIAGVPNLHSHAFQRAMAGLTEARGTQPDDFWSWRTSMYALVDRLDPDQFEAVSAQAFVEMLEAGFTRVGEFHYLHHSTDGCAYGNPAEMSTRIAAAAATTGIGLTLLPVLYCQGGFGAAQTTPAQRRFVTSIDAYQHLWDFARRAIAALPDARIGVAPHSLRAVTPEQLRAVVQFAGQAPIHIHASEQRAEVDACLAWSGQRPIEWLANHAPLDARWCVVHATHMTDSEVVRLARSGAVAGLCPITEANLGDGIFRAREFMEAGGRFGLGSDSNVLIAANEELRLLEYGQRLANQQRNVLASTGTASVGRAIFAAAIGGGGRALGTSQVGLVVGAPADIVSLDVRLPALSNRHGDALLDSWIFATRGAGVDCVWRRGIKYVEGGVHRRRDAVRSRFDAAMRSLQS